MVLLMYIYFSILYYEKNIYRLSFSNVVLRSNILQKKSGYQK